MSTALVQYNPVNTLADARAVAETLALSNYFDAKGNNPVALAQIATKILAGREMGYGPFASVNGIHIIQGRPSVSANLMAAAVKASGRYDYRVRQMTADVCEIEFFERVGDKRESLGVSSFTKQDAAAAKTQNMDKFARNMLFARAMSNGVKWFVPDVFNGNAVYVPEELGATVDGDGNVIDVTPTPLPSVIVEPTQPTTNGNGNGERDKAFDKFHAIGTDLYGKEWATKRHEQVKAATKGRTESSKELTDKELADLTAILQRRLDAKRKELDDISIKTVAEINPDGPILKADALEYALTPNGEFYGAK